MEKFVATIKLLKGMPTYVHHNLGTKDVIIQAYDLANEQVIVSLKVFDGNIVEVEGNGETVVKIVVIG